jgi:hypothetical protein
MAPPKSSSSSSPEQMAFDFDDTPIGMLPNGELNVVEEEDFSAENDVPDDE